MNTETQNKLAISKKTALIVALITLLCIFFELIASNMPLLAHTFNNNKFTKLSFDETSVVNYGNKIETIETDEIIFDNINTPTSTVDIKFSGEIGYSNLEIYITDENFAYSFQKAGNYRFLNSVKQEYNSFEINPAGNLKSLKIVFNDNCDHLILEDIVLNRTPSVSFNLFRLLIIWLLAIGIYLILKFKIWNIEYNCKLDSHRIVVTIAVAICMICPLFVNSFMTPEKQPEKFYEYPLTAAPSNYGLYTLQFDAFLKGQLNLDVVFDGELLSSIENPYDNSDRKENAEGNGGLWDSAFYDGKLYSYFGVAPIIFFYYPLHFMFGEIPTEYTVLMYLAIFTALFMSLAFLEIQKYFCKKPPVLLTVLGIFTVNFASLALMCQACGNMYYMACLSGILFLGAFLYTSFRAVRTKNNIKRNIFFALSGISCASIVASRPIVVLYALLVVPIFISFLLKQGAMKSKIFSVVSFFTPLVILGICIMWYNAARFSSPFDFGVNYNLTVSDVSKNTIRLFLFYPAMYHTFLQPFYTNAEFPFIHIHHVNFASYRSYIYITSTIGVMSYPAVWGLLTTGFSLKGKENRAKKYTVLLAILTFIAIGFSTTSLSGVHIRYSTDILFVAVLLGVVLLSLFASKIKDISYDLYKLIMAISVLLCIVSIAIGFALIFDNEQDLILKNQPEMYYLFESLFK